MMRRTAQFVRKHFDDVAIVGSLAHLSLVGGTAELSERDAAVMAALQRANPDLADASPEEVSEYLAGMNDDQLEGVVSNVKGVLHEMDFARIENADGDAVYAALFPETNHPGTDVRLIDSHSGESWEVQLKATDSHSAVNEWIDTHPDGEILVTNELAANIDAEGVDSSGFSNADLTHDVNGFVDRMVDADDGDSIWSYFPLMTTASVALVVWTLWQRHQAEEIDYATFKRLAIAATGMKVAKFAVLTALLAIPVVGQITGAALIAKLLLSIRRETRQPGEAPQLQLAPSR